jgi:predicted NAD-dependent protein-ADP-ribosyltransferase YbiA (DUF1768 family)
MHSFEASPIASFVASCQLRQLLLLQGTLLLCETTSANDIVLGVYVEGRVLIGKSLLNSLN